MTITNLYLYIYLYLLLAESKSAAHLFIAALISEIWLIQIWNANDSTLLPRNIGTVIVRVN